MILLKQTAPASPTLLLVFSGWAASPDLFRPIGREPGTDLCICYDYRKMDFDFEMLSGYREIRLVAWSLGVWAASLLFARRSIPFADAIAIGGTPCPLHDRWGIPEAIFRGTLDNLTEEGLHRFNRRMCGGRALLESYEQIPPRPLAEVREELEWLFAAIKGTPAGFPLFDGWTRAIIPSGDRIFPADNQRAYWKGRCPVTEIEAPHCPFHLWKQWNELWSR